MNSLNKQIKKHVRVSLKGNMLSVICATLVILLLNGFIIFFEKYITKLLNIDPYINTSQTTDIIRSTIPNMSIKSFYITFTIILFYALIINPLWIGLRKITTTCISNSQMDFYNLFYYFRNPKIYFKTLFLQLYIFIRILLLGIICIAPGSLIIYFDQYYIPNSLLGRIYYFNFSASILTLMGIILIILGIFITIIYSSKFSLALYLFIESPEQSILRCVKYSSIYTKRQIGNLFSFKMSFFPIILTGIFILPVLYIIPYYISSCSAYSRYLIEFNRTMEKEIN